MKGKLKQGVAGTGSQEGKKQMTKDCRGRGIRESPRDERRGPSKVTGEGTELKGSARDEKQRRRGRAKGIDRKTRSGSKE